MKLKKIKAILTLDINQFENIKPEIEISVPDELENEALVMWLHNKYHGICTPQKKSTGTKYITNLPSPPDITQS